MQESVEAYREEALRRVFSMPVFEKGWPIWRAEIARLTKDLQDDEAIYRLGGNLRGIFRKTAKKKEDKNKGRDQNVLASGGAAWEGLVCWYLNLVLTHTPAAVGKHSKSLIPKPVLDAISINYNNKPTNSESDLIGVTFPSEMDAHVDGFDHRAISDFVGRNMGKTSVHIIQCKTSWNDSAQNPMLWDLVYRAKGFNAQGISIGNDARDIDDLKRFTYSFVALPSQNKPFKADGMPVRRVAALSGKNFWGLPSQECVAWSIGEMFKLVFGSSVIGDVREHIRNLIENNAINLDPVL